MKKKYLNLMVLALMTSMSTMTFTARDDDDDNNGDGSDNGKNEIVVANGTELKGVVDNGQTVVLKAGNSFTLSGGYTVKNGGVLKIEEGVTITAVEDDAAD